MFSSSRKYNKRDSDTGTISPPQSPSSSALVMPSLDSLISTETHVHEVSAVSTSTIPELSDDNVSNNHDVS
jgi:hypothetical protein